MKENGVAYLPKALERGARTFVVPQDAQIDQHILGQIYAQGGRILSVADTRHALAELSALMLGKPASKLKIIAITGTKGKTTTAFLLEHLLKNTGYKVALLSSVENRIFLKNFPAHLTTHHPDYLHAFFDLCVRAGVEWVVMEVAAQAVSLKRVAGLAFDAVIFTNFSKEHGEFYTSIDDYFAAKKSLLGQVNPDGLVLLNRDDADVASLSQSFCRTKLFTLESPSADLTASLIKSDIMGLQGNLTLNDEEAYLQVPNLMGKYNLYNIAAATLCASALGIDMCSIKQALAYFPGVPGRLNRYNLPNGAYAFIDQAPNPVSFEATLSTLSNLTSHLIVVFGAGGDRDPSRRPLMGAVAAKYGDVLVLTTDNPRSEDPATIIEQICQGIPASCEYTIELDREKAIRFAYQQSSAQSIIALLGKGPERYQIVKGVKIPFSEPTILESLK